ncbi:discoidin domain-containing protein [Mycobacterium sp. DBP42]|uniref:discoidin domain-containing protein n=1 Tax=Mycobacteriaceae TaxID=1762 RepID=UPI00110CF6AB|nr:discoidin domain-containing protein [Mycobacterium sp. DBP42]TMS50711.1 discoidin domain-containing protein [Mycobacterium sp. DBP42]
MTTTPSNSIEDAAAVLADKTWENRAIVMASIAPRSTSRPARRIAPTEADTAEPADDREAKAPGLLARGAYALGRGIRASADKVAAKIPPNRRLGAVVLAVVVLVVFVVALSLVRSLAADTSPAAPTRAHAAPAPLPPTSAGPKDAILTGITAKDSCPKGENDPYSPANAAFDGNLGTAWICTRADGKDDQFIQVDFGRQCTVSQTRIESGFDARIPDAPGGVDQWDKHRVITKAEVYFPKELGRKPLPVETGGARDFRPGFIDPPATVSKLLIKIVETAQPPRTGDTTTDTETPAPNDDVTTVASSEIQFLGYCA